MGKDAKILILGSLAAGLLLVTGAPWLARAEADAFAPSREGAAQGGTAGLGGPFAPTDQNGRRVTDTRVLAEPALPYFGYACCPGVCPMDNARNAEAVSIPEERGIRATPVFITVDPRRDTPEMLKDFAAAIHPRMIGLTGSRAEIDAVSKAWRNYYRSNDQQDTQTYLVDHMTNTCLVLPAAGTVEIFGRDLSAQQRADRTACFIDVASNAGI